MRRILQVLLAVALLSSMLWAQGLTGAGAAEPAQGTLHAKDQGTSTLKYEGTVPPGSGGVGDSAPCEDQVNADFFKLTLDIPDPDNFYKNHSSLLAIDIRWDPTSVDVAVNDLALFLRDPQGDDIASSDGGTNQEQIAVENLPGGEYTVVACAFANSTPQPYQASASLTTTSLESQVLPRASNARGLKFMPIVTVDPQRDVAEPSIRIDKSGKKAGNVYACGPFGASRGADYANKSEDGGDTFRVLGEPPEGRIAPGGGGDCDLAVAPKKNPEGFYNVYYSGLEALANFSFAASYNEGRTWVGGNSTQSVPLVDRQWLEAAGRNEVYLFYNQIPFGGTLQHSTNGVVYEPASEPGNAAPDIGRPGNIVVDLDKSRNPADPAVPDETVYGTYTNGNKVEVFRTTDGGQTFENFRVVRAKGAPDNLFPAIDIDTAGNLYVAWVEKGSYNTFYSYSTDHGETWSRKQLVNRRGAESTLMPWIVAGSPGRIAVSTYCSSVDGNPEIGGVNGFHAPWHVCVNQSFNALGGGADFSQVHATHHPIHWDSICTLGLGCSVSGGDRTLLDFFQMRLDPHDGRLHVVFNESNKQPRAEAGPIAIVTTSKQKAGPSMYRDVGTVQPDRRASVRSASSDPLRDARYRFSSFGQVPERKNFRALDLEWLRLSPTKVDDKQGLKIQMKLKDLSDAALTEAAARLGPNLKFVVRWFSAYRPDYVVADWKAGQWTFAEGNLKREMTTDGKLEIYPAPGPGRHLIEGKANQETGVITMLLKYRAIQDFDLGSDLEAKPTVGSAKPGDKIYEVTAWTFGRPILNPGDEGGADVLDYYNQADSTPSFDYVLKRAPR